MNDFIVKMEMETFMGVPGVYKICIIPQENDILLCTNTKFAIHPRKSITKEFRISIEQLVYAFLDVIATAKIYVQDKKPLHINLTDRRMPVSDLVRYVYNYVNYDLTKWIAKLPPIVPPAPKHGPTLKIDYARDYGLPFALMDDMVTSL